MQINRVAYSGIDHSFDDTISKNIEFKKNVPFDRRHATGGIPRSMTSGPDIM